MKELSIEEKAKRYDEAIKKAEPLYKTAEHMSGCNVIIETLFPELAESEDERIRKALINFFLKSAVDGESTNGIPDEDIIAWLEKQGERSDANKEYWRGYNEGKQCILDKYAEIEKQGEQKPAENEELTEFDKAVGVSIGTWNPKTPEQIQSVKAVSKKLLKLAKKQINDEQNPAWSEEDEEIISVLAAICHVNAHASCAKLIDWLKSLKERVQPQPSKEWSEEDENLLTDTEYLLQVIKMENRSDNEYQRAENCLAWLKSLKPQKYENKKN